MRLAFIITTLLVALTSPLANAGPEIPPEGGPLLKVKCPDDQFQALCDTYCNLELDYVMTHLDTIVFECAS
jgi:hypothetical protein